MSILTVLITGANRGLGLALTKQYAEDGWQVLACCRAPNAATALQTLAKQHQTIKIIPLDVADFKAIDKLANALATQPIDLLINNAGVYPEGELGNLDTDAWAEAFRINSMAPLK